MTPFFLIRTIAALFAALGLSQAHAQERIYRCGNEYTNNAEVAKSKGCTPLEGGNITVIQGTLPQRSSATSSAAPKTSAPVARSGNDRIKSSEQRARDSDAKTILETELRQAQERLAEARKAYANGEPEKQGIESRNYQRYLDRVADLKAAVGRAENDVAGIQRELTRLTGTSGGTGSAAQ